MATHDTIMGRFVDSGFILENTLTIASTGNRLILMKGSLPCLGEIRLDVEKLLKVVEGTGMNALVRTVEYRYNASIFLGNIFRYDSPHPDHNQFHHVHRFDVFGGDFEGTIGRSDWPHLGDVIDELEEWHYANYDRLYPTEHLGSE